MPLIPRLKHMFDVKKQFSIPQKQLTEWYSQSVSARNEANNQFIDKKLINWDEMLDNTPDRKIKPFHVKTNVVFFHVPKTAGTTLDFIISKNLPVWGIFKQHGADFDRNVAAFYKSGDAPKTVMGHNELNEYYYQLLSRERLIHITTIREPVARVVSYYDFLRAQSAHPSHELAQSLSLDEFVKSSRSDEVNNAQAFRLLGLLKHSEYKRDQRSEQELINDSIHQLINRFTLFGTTKQFDAFLLMMSKMMNWQDVYYSRQNVTNKKFKTNIDELPQSVIDTIIEHNQVDIGLYEKAEEVFSSRAKQMNITDDVVSDFRDRNHTYQKLIKQNQLY